MQCTKKTNEKHRPYNIQKTQRKSTGHTMCKKGKRTNIGHTMYKKDKGQTQATKGRRRKKDKHRQYNVKKRQRTNTDHTIDKKDK